MNASTNSLPIVPKAFAPVIAILCFAFLFCSALYDWRAGEMLGGYETTASLVLIGLAFSVAAYIGSTLKLSSVVLIGGFLIGTLNIFLVNAAKQAERNQFVYETQKSAISRAQVQVELWENRAKQAMDVSKYINPKIQENLDAANRRLDREVQKYHLMMGPLGEVSHSDYGYKVIAQSLKSLNISASVMMVSFAIEGFRSILFIVSLIYLMQVLRLIQHQKNEANLTKKDNAFNKKHLLDEKIVSPENKPNLALPNDIYEMSASQDEHQILSLKHPSSASKLSDFCMDLSNQATKSSPIVHHDAETENTPWDAPDTQYPREGNLADVVNFQVELTDSEEDNYQLWLEYVMNEQISASQEDALKVFGLRYSKWRWYTDRAIAEGVLTKGDSGHFYKKSHAN